MKTNVYAVFADLLDLNFKHSFIFLKINYFFNIHSKPTEDIFYIRSIVRILGKITSLFSEAKSDTESYR